MNQKPLIKEQLFIILILIIAFILRLSYLMHGFNYDELYTINHYLKQSNLYDALFKNYAFYNHIGCTALAYITSHLAGINEITVRLWSIIFGLGSIFLMWLWTRECFGKTVAIISTILLAFIPCHIIWSTIARGYSGVLFFTLLSTLIYFRLLKEVRWRLLVGFMLTNFIGITFHVFFIDILLVQIAHLIWIAFWLWRQSASKASFKPLIKIALSLGLTLLLFILMFFPLMGKRLLNSKGVNDYTFTLNFPWEVFNGLLSISWWPFSIAAIVLIISGAFFKFQNNSFRSYVTIVFCSFFAIWLVQPPFLVIRFFSFLVPFILLFMALGLYNIISFLYKYLGKFSYIFAILVLFCFIRSWNSNPSILVNEQVDQFKEAAVFAQNISPLVRYCSFGQDEEHFTYYFKGHITTFKSFAEFKGFYEQGGNVVCFAMPSHQMSIEHWKIFLVMLKNNAAVKQFGQVNVFYLP